MPDEALTITCEIKIPAREELVHKNEDEVHAEETQSSEEEAASVSSNEELKTLLTTLILRIVEVLAAFDDDSVEKNNENSDDEDNEESKNKKKEEQLCQLKNTEKNESVHKNEVAVLAEESQSSEEAADSVSSTEELKTLLVIAILKLVEVLAASDNDPVEESNENSDNEDKKESKNEKKEEQLCQLKNTKKISFPAQHGSVIRSLEAILSEGRRPDFTLKSGGREWPVHRAILEGRSRHFEALLRGEWAERDEVRFDDVTEGALDGVLHFIYAGEVGDMSDENVCGLYAAVHKFLLEDLKLLCVGYMTEKMCPEMVCGALVIAETDGETDLKERAMECYFRESDRIVATDGWKQLKKSHPAIIGELFEEFIKRERNNRKK